jgi:tRNA A37 N6-isopentenylltransferase MiaA
MLVNVIAVIGPPAVGKTESGSAVVRVAPSTAAVTQSDR